MSNNRCKNLTQESLRYVLVRELEPGDKFLVRNKLAVLTNSEMKKHCSRWVTVKSSLFQDNRDLFLIEEDNGEWVWRVHSHINIYETNMRLLAKDNQLAKKNPPRELPFI